MFNAKKERKVNIITFLQHDHRMLYCMFKRSHAVLETKPEKENLGLCIVVFSSIVRKRKANKNWINQ